jgi:DNA polymerase I-like protein with 3'-5' exonuclease and polymerase domains
MLDRDASELPIDALVKYNGLDVFTCWDAQRVMDKTGATTMPDGLFQRELDEEMELTRRATKMARRGIPINDSTRTTRLAEYTAQQLLIAEQARQLVSRPEFNIGSSLQLARALEQSGIRVKWSTETGKPVLNGNEIRKILKAHPQNQLLKLVQEYRKLEKEIDAYSALEPGWDGHVHTSYKIHGTVGTRWSSAGPNLQNLTYPQREVLG